MAVSSTLTLLENLQTMISNAENAIASYQVGDIRVTRAQNNLATLYKRYDQLLTRYNRDQNGPMVQRANFNQGV